MYEGKCYSSCPERSFMVREKPKPVVTDARSKSGSLRAVKRDEQSDLLLESFPHDATTSAAVNLVPQKLCAACHFSCLRCRGPNDYDCTDCAPDSYLKIIFNQQGTCVEIPIDKTAQATNILLVQLTSNEILLIAICLAAIAFVIAIGIYFFFRHICFARKTNSNSYAYNALNDEERLRLTYSRDSAIAFKREVDSIVNDESSSISCSDDDADDYDYGNDVDADDGTTLAVNNASTSSAEFPTKLRRNF